MAKDWKATWRPSAEIEVKPAAPVAAPPPAARLTRIVSSICRSRTNTSLPWNSVSPASNDEAYNRHALEQMKRVLKAETRPSHELDLDAMKRGGFRNTQ